MPVRHRDLGDELAQPQPKRCKHCDESRSLCGREGESGSGRESWRVTLDHDLVETLSAIYPEWFKQPQHRRPPSPDSSEPATPLSDDALSWSAESEMAGREGSSSGSGPSEPASSPPRNSPPKVIVDDSPLQPAMGKHKESLKVKLMMRRPINQLVAQGIMPPLKTPPAYFEQCKQLERAKTGDLLKAKIQRRPDRQELERRHILEQESHVDPSLAEKQRMLKKARLADALNDQLSHRPGPLELIKKNILHTEEEIETAVKSGVLEFRATCEGASGRPALPAHYTCPDEVVPVPPPLRPAPADVSPSPSPPAAQHPAPGKDKNRKKTKHKHQPKARFKFHEYKGPPNAHRPADPPAHHDPETPYELLLQQQQLLLQLMVPASPAASVHSDSSDALPPPPPPLPPPSRFQDMKVSDLRAECKRRNLRVSGPKPQLLDRLRPYLVECKEEPPRSPASIASPDPIKQEPENPPEDIVQSQRRQIEDLERKLEASRQQLEAVRRDAAGAAASDQSRRLLQAHLCVSQLRAQLDALTAPPAPPPPPAARLVLTADSTAPDRLVRLFTATAAAPDSANTYFLNGVKVLPIAILPTHYETEPPAPPPPPPLPPLPTAPPAPRPDEDDSQMMDDVLEILVENGELPPSAVSDTATESGYLSSAVDTFSPGEVLGDEHMHDTLASDDLQRELNDIQNEILNHCDMNGVHDVKDESMSGLDADLEVELMGGGGYGPPVGDSDDLFTSLLEHKDDVDMEVAPPVISDMMGGVGGFEDMDVMALSPFRDTGRGRCAGVCDPLLGGAGGLAARPPPPRLYSWDRLDLDAT